MRSALSILVLFCLTACHGGDNGGPEYNLNVRDIWDLQLTLASDATPAGESVGLEVQLISEDGDIEEVQDWTLESDSESPIQWSRDSVTPTHAAVHHLTAFANANDKTYSADATLIVGAGAAYVVDLALSDHGVTAGDSLNWTLSAADETLLENIFAPAPATRADDSVAPQGVAVEASQPGRPGPPAEGWEMLKFEGVLIPAPAGLASSGELRPNLEI